MKAIFGTLLFSLAFISLAFASTSVRSLPRYDRQITLGSSSGDGSDVIILLNGNRVTFYSNSEMNGLKLIGPANGTDLQTLAKKSEALAKTKGKVSAGKIAKDAAIGAGVGAATGAGFNALALLAGNVLISTSAGFIQPTNAGIFAAITTGLCVAAGSAIAAFENYSNKRCYKKLAHALEDLNDKTSTVKDTTIWLYGGDPVKAVRDLLK